MRRYLFVLAIATFVLAGCRSTKETSKTNQKEVWQTLLVKQLDAKVDDQIITVKYNIIRMLWQTTFHIICYKESYIST